MASICDWIFGLFGRKKSPVQDIIDADEEEEVYMDLTCACNIVVYSGKNPALAQRIKREIVRRRNDAAVYDETSYDEEKLNRCVENLSRDRTNDDCSVIIPRVFVFDGCCHGYAYNMIVAHCRKYHLSTVSIVKMLDDIDDSLSKHVDVIVLTKQHSWKTTQEMSDRLFEKYGGLIRKMHPTKETFWKSVRNGVRNGKWMVIRRTR